MSGLEINLASTDSWGTGGNGNMIVKNIGTTTIANWKFQLVTSGFTITQFWNFVLGGSGTNITVSAPAWATSLAPGATATSGFAYTGSQNFVASSPDGGKIVITPPTTTTPPPTTTPPTPPSNNTSTFPSLTSNKKVFGYFSEWNIY